ncbi:MAG: hypothetical protein P8K77_05535 [Polaribacter sp.]|nr:hypothetical protein [Polaribacter sp.]
MKKKSLICCFFLMTFSMVAQKSIHNYKYIVVSEKFSFLRTLDQYKTSSLTKFLFNKYGFTAYLDSEKLPADFNKNRCLALFADAKDASNFMQTKIVIELKDCDNNVLFVSTYGKSKIKTFKEAYHEAIRKAFKYFEKLEYKYAPIKVIEKVVDTTHSKPKTVEKTPVVETKPAAILKTTKSVPVAVKKKTVTANGLYAYPSKLGYELKDRATLKIVFTMLKTNLTDVYIVKENNGILYKRKDSWFMEFYRNNKRVQKQIQIKF